MDYNKKLEFVHRMTKLGLQHFDAGGSVQPAGAVTLSGPAPATGATGPTASGGLTGAIGSFLGTQNNYKAGSANITPGTNTAQLNDAYTGNQTALNQQGTVANALTPGVSQGANAESALSGEFANEAAGNGPNPANTELATATGNNIAATTSALAGARGSSGNVGLMARQIGQQGAATQQNSVGQAATLNAEQELAAQQGLAGLSANQISQGTGATTANTQAQESEQNILQNANTSANNAAVSMQSNINNVNAGVAQGNQSNSGGILGGVTSALSQIPIIGGLFAEGGQVPVHHGYMKMRKFASGGPVIAASPLNGNVASAPTTNSFVGNWLNSPSSSGGPQVQSAPSYAPSASSSSALSTAGTNLGSAVVKGVNALTQPAESTGNGNGGAPNGGNGLQYTLEAKGGMLASKGGKVKAKSKAEKAVSPKGTNSYANDKIPTLLSEGEIVLPREVTQHPRAPEMAAAFVRATLAKKGLKQGLKK